MRLLRLLILIIVIITINKISTHHAQVHAVIRQWGTSGTDKSLDLVIGIYGNIYVTGLTNGALDGNENLGSYDLYLTKWFPNMTKHWTKQVSLCSLSRSVSVSLSLFPNSVLMSLISPLSPSLCITLSDSLSLSYSLDHQDTMYQPWRPLIIIIIFILQGIQMEL